MSSSEDRHQVTNLWQLPKVFDIQYQYVQYSEPQEDLVGGTIVLRNDAVEILVRTDGPLPIRAVAATLIVGSTPVTEARSHSSTLYRFIAYNYRDLSLNAPIFLGWPQYPQMTIDTGFFYTPPPPVA